MSEIDTSAEAVERLAREHDLVRFTLSMKSPQHDKTAATLRALLAERDTLRKALHSLVDVSIHRPIEKSRELRKACDVLGYVP
jgi:hypothetical protein